MPSLLKKSLTFFVSSDPDTGAANVSADGSEFALALNHPIMIPANALSCNLRVIQAAIWNTSPNLSADFGNNVFNFTTNHSGLPVVYNIVLPDGLYSLSGLGAYLSTQFVNNGLPSNLITLSGDDATQQTVLTFLVAGDFVDFSVPNSCREILGFNSRLAPLTPQIAGYSEFSDNSAAFNRNNSYLIRTNLVSDGIPINTTNNGIISNVPIDVSPGSQIVYSPRNPLVVDASELIGAIRQRMNFALLNQSLEPTPTAGEIYSLTIEINYIVPV